MGMSSSEQADLYNFNLLFQNSSVMNITEFFELSFGRWRSQRSGYHLAFAHFEEILSTIDIVPLNCDDEAVIEVYKINDINPHDITHPFRMTWEGESDWDDKTYIYRKLQFKRPSSVCRCSKRINHSPHNNSRKHTATVVQ
jgi:hypothetical protein